MMRRHRFTLVELLVVLAVIALLAGLILAATSRARRRGRATACIGQLRQIGAAIHMYADDHDGYLPRCARLWPEPDYGLPSLRQALGDYVTEPRLWHCPADPELFADVGTSYEWNTLMSGYRMDRSRIAIGDMILTTPMAGDADPWHGSPPRHYLYVDGRVTGSAEILIE